MEIVSRAAWEARPPTSKVVGDVVTETFLHHTAGSGGGAAYMRAIQDYHMDVKGWSDIAYNFVVDPDSLVVYEGRGWGVRPGSQKSYNRDTWSVCVMGNYQTKQPTQGLLETIAGLINLGANLGHIPSVLTGGHKDAPDQSTSCPGANLYIKIPTIRTLMEDDMVDRNTKLGASATLAPVFDKAREVGVFSEYTEPDTIVTPDQLAAFLDRAGVLQPGTARTWTKTQIVALIAASATGGATAAEVIDEVIRRLAG